MTDATTRGDTRFRVVVSDLAFPEGPRWHDGALWLSDMQGGRVLRVRPGMGAETVVALDDCPSGLGFLPDGRLLVVAMHARQVLRLDPGGLVLHADLSHLATGHANDMLVDSHGRAYVGNFGDDTSPPTPVTPAVLALVGPDGTVTPAADNLLLPNGMALVDDGRTLVVAETRALPPRISTFDIGPDGSLSGRRTLIELDTEMPDGIAAGAQDALWVASPFTSEVLKVSRQGVITARLSVPRPPYACALGGDRATDLFICVADDWRPEVCRERRSGAVLVTEVASL